MAKAVKLADIAKMYNVSTVTVSKALSGQKGVSEELRAQIVETAQELGYSTPTARRRENREGKSYNLGVIISERFLSKYNSFYMQLYQMISAQAISRECVAILEGIPRDMENALEIPRLIKEEKIDGVIICGWLEKNYLEKINAALSVPAIYLDFYDPHTGADAVISDSFYGAATLTNYLFENGHTKIAFVGTVGSTNSITDRYLGYMKALIEHGQSVRSDWVIDDRSRVTGKMDADVYFRLPEEMPTAFVCNCDLAASMLIKKLEDKGLRIPQDVSVVGYDHFLYPGLCDVPLTTYEVDMKEMAKKSVRNLISKIKGDPYKSGVIIIEGKLLVRESVRTLTAEEE